MLFSGLGAVPSHPSRHQTEGVIGGAEFHLFKARFPVVDAEFDIHRVVGAETTSLVIDPSVIHVALADEAESDSEFHRIGVHWTGKVGLRSVSGVRVFNVHSFGRPKSVSYFRCVF